MSKIKKQGKDAIFFRPGSKIFAWLKKKAEEQEEAVSTIIRISLRKVMEDDENSTHKQ